MVNNKSGSTQATTIRNFEFVDEKSSKFWEIALNGLDLKVRFGKIGTTGQTQEKTFTDAATATNHADKLVAEKLGKGYREILATKALAKDAKQALLDEHSILLDLRQSELERTIYLHMPEEFALAEKEGRPPLANICLTGNVDVETIIFPANMTGWEYCVIRDMPNLRELHVKRIAGMVLMYGNKRIQRNPSPDTLQWLILKDLPKLEKITVEGSIFWLQIEDLPSLKVIDVQGCDKLDYFSVLKVPKLDVVNVVNCRKLRTVVGLAEKAQVKLGVTYQIEGMQAKSKRDGAIYKNMTFTDIDHVLWTINYGVKIASLRGLFKGVEDICYGREDDPDFNNFSFALLRPLEFVYTGGTGETYAYEVLCHDYSNGQYGAYNSVGNGTQEDCLDYALQTVSCMYLDIPGKRDPTNKQILKFLNALVAEETLS